MVIRWASTSKILNIIYVLKTCRSVCMMALRYCTSTKPGEVIFQELTNQCLSTCSSFKLWFSPFASINEIAHIIHQINRNCTL